MTYPAVFLDRDKTLIADPGYISDPKSVKLLPGVEIAIQSLRQAGYKIVVVTNQSGVARGMLTEEALEKIHAEMRRQLSEKSVHLDAIYYCPFHPEGSVDEFTGESELRKPQPGMLLKAAEEMDLDLSASWMIGDSARDVEAGQRAGCRTIRLRVGSSDDTHHSFDDDLDENVQADHVARSLVDAARIIIRSGSAGEDARNSSRASSIGTGPGVDPKNDHAVRLEILRHVRRLATEQHSEEFSFLKLLAAVVQMLVLMTLVLTFWRMLENHIAAATLWAVISVALQVMALTFVLTQRNR